MRCLNCNKEATPNFVYEIKTYRFEKVPDWKKKKRGEIEVLPAPRTVRYEKKRAICNHCFQYISDEGVRKDNWRRIMEEYERKFGGIDEESFSRTKVTSI